MSGSRRLAPVLGGIVLALAAGALAQGTPVAANSTAVLNAGVPMVSVFLLPDGTGNALTNCYGPGGIAVAATIDVTIRDVTGVMIPFVSNREIRLNEAGTSLAWCPDALYPPPQHAPNCADADTDLAGRTSFTQAYRGFGNHAGPTQVWVLEASGLYQPIPNLLPIQFNSPDVNSDGIINLSDIALFAQDLFSGPAPYRSDFNWDGVINLSDIVLFAQGLYSGGCQ